MVLILYVNSFPVPVQDIYRPRQDHRFIFSDRSNINLFYIITSQSDQEAGKPNDGQIRSSNNCSSSDCVTNYLVADGDK